MDNKRLTLYYIDSDYINYLREFDNRVPYNKNARRPYIGIVYVFNNNNYFAPLSSPKEKHLKMRDNTVDIWKIDEGKLGIINFNNMVPCSFSVLTEVMPTVKDKVYKKLLQNQITQINLNKKKILNKASNFHKQYNAKALSKSVFDRCCDFRLLEGKCSEYSKKIEVYA